jgi:hypothetical protein
LSRNSSCCPAPSDESGTIPTVVDYEELKKESIAIGVESI